MTAERPLEDATVARSVEDGAPLFKLADAGGRLERVELGHPDVVEQLAADHRVAEVGLPRVTVVDVAEGRCDAPLGHDRVGLAQQRLADEPDGAAGCGGLDRRAKPRTAGPDHQDVVAVDVGVRDHAPDTTTWS